MQNCFHQLMRISYFCVKMVEHVGILMDHIFVYDSQSGQAKIVVQVC